MSRPAVLAADGLTRLFPRPPGHTTFAAVSDVSFELREHGILGVVGPNGAGKTTLIDMLAGVITPSAGTIRGEGVRGYLPSGGRALYPRLTVRQNLEFFGALHGVCGADLRERVDECLRLVEASEAADTRVDRLSDGLAARASLARTLLPAPDVLLLDEPARSIDSIHRPALLRVIRAYTRSPGRAAVMVTHDLEDVFTVCDRVAVMHNGRVLRIDEVATGAERGALRAALEETAS